MWTSDFAIVIIQIRLGVDLDALTSIDLAFPRPRPLSWLRSRAAENSCCLAVQSRIHWQCDELIARADTRAGEARRKCWRNRLAGLAPPSNLPPLACDFHSRNTRVRIAQSRAQSSESLRRHVNTTARENTSIRVGHRDRPAISSRDRDFDEIEARVSRERS